MTLGPSRIGIPSTSTRLRFIAPACLPLAAILLVASPSYAASWQAVSTYGGSTAMNLYVPDNVDDSPGVVVALHSCGNQYESDSQNYVKTSADQYGFIIIQPTNGNPDCWTADAGQDGEKPDIIAMVQYVVDNNNADPTKVFAVGASSGACMTLALLATHPDIFAAGATLAGVPYGAWSAGGTCSVCSQQPTVKSESEWGDIVRQNAPSGYAGPWPRAQLWHGTADTTLNYGWLAEAEKQWKNVHGLTGSGTEVTGPNKWTRTEYTKDGAVVLQVNIGANLPHYLPGEAPQADIVGFFGLDVDTPTGAGGSGAGGESSLGGGSGLGGGDTGGGGNLGGASSAGGSGSGGATSSSGGATSSAGGATSSSGGASAGGSSGTSSCIAGVQTGDECDPAIDTAECVRSTRTCTCGTNSEWTCVATGGEGGGTSAGGRTGVGGAAAGGAPGSGGTTPGYGGTPGAGLGAGLGGAVAGVGGAATAGTPAAVAGGAGALATGGSSTAGDSGVATDETEKDEGCGCVVPGSGSPRGVLSVLLGAGLLAILGRRRRNRSA